ncbi:MAG: pitrilysin family protein [candidate division NC10 bacterium]|nr:pitrilysin family protein [candidate division NC10 bacterium]
MAGISETKPGCLPLESFCKKTFPNGLTLLTEKIPHVQSVSIGVWSQIGSRHEPAELAGISHFLEHMFFKGTTRRSAEEIARAIDSVGGSLDAFTSREHTCFYAKVLGEHLPLAIDLLADILLCSRMEEAEMEKERQVIQQEIKMVEDSPDDLVHDLFARSLWPDHPLGRPVLGNLKSLARTGRQDLLAFLQDYYRPNHCIIAAAGNLEHEQVADLIWGSFGGWSGAGLPTNTSTPLAQHCRWEDRRDLSQVHLCLGVPGLPYAHEDRYVLYLLNCLLGGGMSSRLFQEVRERAGLVYSIYSYQASFHDCGQFVIYAGTGPEQYGEVLRLIEQELVQLQREPLLPEELQRTKDQLRGNLLLGLESTSARMMRLAKMEIYFGQFFHLEEIIQGIEEITAERVKDLAGRLFGSHPYTLTAIGPIP